MSRDQILAAIQISLNANRPQLLAEAARVTHEPPPFVLPAQDDLAGQFVAEVQKLEGKAYRVATAEEALAIIEQLIIETQARQVIGWDVDQIELPGLAALLAAHGVTPAIADIRGEARQARLQELEPIPICLSGLSWRLPRAVHCCCAMAPVVRGLLLSCRRVTSRLSLNVSWCVVLGKH